MCTSVDVRYECDEFAHKPGSAKLNTNGNSKQPTKRKRNTWFTHDNGARPFMVKVTRDRGMHNVTVSKFDAHHFEGKENANNYKQILSYDDVADVIIGKSTPIPMTVYSGGYGNEFDGNTILLKLKTDDDTHTYVYIGDCIYEFQTPTPILQYHSPVGNNDVSYPIAITGDNAYFMIYHTYIARSHFPSDYEWAEAYDVYVEHNRDNNLIDAEIRMLHDRLSI
jgi:hypothetical protein